MSNLEWVTNKENRDHAVKNGLHKRYIYEFSKDGVVVFIGGSTEACDKLGLNQSGVTACARGERKSHKGYKIKKI